MTRLLLSETLIGLLWCLALIIHGAELSISGDEDTSISIRWAWIGRLISLTLLLTGIIGCCHHQHATLLLILLSLITGSGTEGLTWWSRLHHLHHDLTTPPVNKTRR
ncbi:MAG: hypothetical protein J5965_16580 [Aeriscardovia sp.]|nr:hypothetical protein [Aeriscardovia sp.]